MKKIKTNINIKELLKLLIIYKGDLWNDPTVTIDKYLIMEKALQGFEMIINDLVIDELSIIGKRRGVTLNLLSEKSKNIIKELGELKVKPS